MKSDRPSISKPKARHTAYDAELIRAKQERRVVTIFMPFEMEFTSASGSFKCTIENVDVYSVKIKIEGQEVWVNKAFIVGVEL